jgi:hypothetical protein
MFLSIVTLHFGPYRFIAQIEKNPAIREATPNMVKSQPFPIAWINGSVMALPMQLNVFRTKLFRATPLLALRGMNSVNIVVTAAKILRKCSKSDA